jgi:hypothetical protein
MKNECGLWVLAAIAMALWLSGCRYARDESDGPTANFRALDANEDGDIDRVEWEDVQGSAFPDSLGFRYADCDADGRMTWHEYFGGYMRLQRCPGTYLYEDGIFASTDNSAGTTAVVTHEDDALGKDWRMGPLVVRADETVQIYAMPPGEIDVPTHLRRKRPPRPVRHTEADLSSAVMQRLIFTSRPIADTVLVSHYDPSEKIPGDEARMVFPRMVCDIGNDNPDIRLTMADLQIVWRVQGNQYRSRVLKTLWVEPRTTQSIHVWFGFPIDTAECRLLHVRGQPAGQKS